MFHSKHGEETEKRYSKSLEAMWVLDLAQLLVLCIGSNLGLKFGRERPIRVLLPHLAEPNIYK